MCLVIDTCTVAKVFNEDAEEHKRFAPIRDWIISQDGKMIYGGRKYIKELGSSRRIVVEMERRGKLVRLHDDRVDKIAKDLKRKEPAKRFDDEHLIAMVIVSRCCVICTDDARAMPYLKRKDLYPKKFKRPKIYQSAKHHSSFCATANVVKICR